MDGNITNVIAISCDSTNLAAHLTARTCTFTLALESERRGFGAVCMSLDVGFWGDWTVNWFAGKRCAI